MYKVFIKSKLLSLLGYVNTPIVELNELFNICKLGNDSTIISYEKFNIKT
jgi:hypothetical protein